MDILFKVDLSEKIKQELVFEYRHNEINFFFVANNDEISEKIKKKIEIIVSFGDSVDKKFLSHFPNLKWLHCFSSGINLLPLKYMQDRNIILTNVKGIHKIPISEYVLGMLLNIVHRNYHFYNLQKEKKWEDWVEVDELSNKTVGIVGLGSIGTEVAKICKSLNMHVIGIRNINSTKNKYIDHCYNKEELDLLLAEADFVVLCLPVTKKTKKIIGKRELAIMKNDAYLINVARGELLDEDALIDALNKKIIQGAILDVFKEEPLSLNSKLWDIPNLLITPHSSGRSPKYIDRAIDTFKENLNLYLQNEDMRNIVSYSLGY